MTLASKTTGSTQLPQNISPSIKKRSDIRDEYFTKSSQETSIESIKSQSAKAISTLAKQFSIDDLNTLLAAIKYVQNEMNGARSSLFSCCYRADNDSEKIHALFARNTGLLENIQKVCYHQNAPLGNRKLSFDGATNYTDTAGALIGNLKTIQASRVNEVKFLEQRVQALIGLLHAQSKSLDRLDEASTIHAQSESLDQLDETSTINGKDQQSLLDLCLNLLNTNAQGLFADTQELLQDIEKIQTYSPKCKEMCGTLVKIKDALSNGVFGGVVINSNNYDKTTNESQISTAAKYKTNRNDLLLSLRWTTKDTGRPVVALNEAPLSDS